MTRRPAAAAAAAAAAAVLLLAAAAAAAAADVDMSSYHTSEELRASFEALGKTCPYVQVSEVRAPGVALPSVRVADPDRAPARHRVLMFFGEHARELISPETALVLARALCAAAGPDAGAGVVDREAAAAARRVLDVAEFLIFPNCNPRGRAKVERGDYCVRSNENGVDLNRNWNDHWQNDEGRAELIRMQSFGGKRPFSEVETVLLKRAAVDFRPTIFMTVHSGTLGIFIPYAWNGQMPTSRKVDDELRTVITRVNKRFCRCPAGPAGKEVGYLCPGTCLDWMYDKLRTQFSYGFEIYGGDTGYIRPAGSSLAEVSAAARGFRAAAAVRRAAARARAAERGDGAFPQPANDGVAKCLTQFNPVSPDVFDKTTQNWAAAFLDVVLESAAVDGSKATT